MSFSCSSQFAQTLPVLLLNFEITTDARISFVDIPLLNARSYTFVNLTAGDNGTELQCFVSEVLSNRAVLIVNVDST